MGGIFNVRGYWAFDIRGGSAPGPFWMAATRDFNRPAGAALACCSTKMLKLVAHCGRNSHALWRLLFGLMEHACKPVDGILEGMRMLQSIKEYV